MSTASPANQRFQLGDLLLDAGTFEVSRDGVVLPVNGKSFAFLLALVRHAPRVVTYDQLMDEVWPGEVVQLETVAQRVKLVRAALGGGTQPDYVIGVRSKGYRLGVDVTELSDVDPATPDGAGEHAGSSPTSEKAGNLRGPQRRTRFALVALATLVLASALLYFRYQGVGVEPAPASASTRETIAVLPFSNVLASDLLSSYTTGMGDWLRAALVAHSELVVTARESSVRAIAGSQDSGEIARQLGVDYVIRGQVSQVAGESRVTAEVFDARRNEILAVVSLTEPDERFLFLQDQLVAQIMHVLVVNRIAATVSDDSSGFSTRSPEAFRSYQHGIARYSRWRLADSVAAAEDFRSAIAIDDSYAEAYVGLAAAETRAVQLRNEPQAEALVRIFGYIERAIEINPQLGDAYALRGSLRLSEDRDRAFEDMREGLRLSPSSADAHSAIANALAAEAQVAEAVAHIDQAIRLDPLASRYRYFRAIMLWPDLAHSQQSETALRQVIARDPDFAPAYARLADWTWWRQLNPAEAIRLAERAVQLDQDTPWLRERLCGMYLDAGDPAAARDVIAGVPLNDARNCLTNIAVFAGDWRTAHQLALDTPADALAAGDHGPGTIAALYDYAARSVSNRERVLKLMDIGIAPADRDYTNTNLVVENVFLEILLRELNGDSDGVAQLVAALWSWLPLEEAAHPARQAYPVRAMLLLWQGDTSKALQALENYADAGHSPFWWFVFQRDPAWRSAKDDPRFVHIVETETRYAAIQRATLDALRAAGDVPVRPFRAAAAGS